MVFKLIERTIMLGFQNEVVKETDFPPLRSTRLEARLVNRL